MKIQLLILKFGLIFIVFLNILYGAFLALGYRFERDFLLHYQNELNELTQIKAKYEEQIKEHISSLENEQITEKELLQYTKGSNLSLGEYYPDKICYHINYGSPFHSSLEGEEQIEYDTLCREKNIQPDTVRESLSVYFEKIQKEKINQENKLNEIILNQSSKKVFSEELYKKISSIVGSDFNLSFFVFWNIVGFSFVALLIAIISGKNIYESLHFSKEKIVTLMRSRKGIIITTVILLIGILLLGKYIYNISHGRICPDEKYTSPYMPGVIMSNEIPTPKHKAGYVVIHGEQKNIENFDMPWIIENCKEPNYFYGY